MENHKLCKYSTRASEKTKTLRLNKSNLSYWKTIFSLRKRKKNQQKLLKNQTEMKKNKLILVVGSEVANF